MDLPGTHLLYKEVDGKKELCVSYSQIESFLQCPYKWYKVYIEGKRSTEKQEATSYGTVIHETLEYFFKNGRRPSGKDLGDAISYYAHRENIPFDSPENMLIAMRESGELLAWLTELFYPGDSADGWKRPAEDLNPVEIILRYGRIAGVEEDLKLPYKLPNPININGITHTHVYIIGSIDLHIEARRKGVVNHYVIDWKSGRRLFDDNKLKTNLQHPIYGFYIYRKYGKLPDMGYYFFTRSRQYQKVVVDKARRDEAISMLNNTFSKMYDFENRTVEKFFAHVEGIKKNGQKGYTIKVAALNEKLPENMKPCPSPLCYYCDFGKYKKNECPYSSDWDPSKKIKR